MTPDEARQRAVEAAARVLDPDAFLPSDNETASAIRPSWQVHALQKAGRILAAAEAALWQPIEMAPADGTRVLVFAPPSGSEYPASVQRVDMWRGGGWRKMRPGQPYTHWRPLSAGPGDAP